MRYPLARTPWSLLLGVAALLGAATGGAQQLPPPSLLDAIFHYEAHNYQTAEAIARTLSEPEAQAYLAAAIFRQWPRRSAEILTAAAAARAGLPGLCCPLTVPGSPGAEVAALLAGFENNWYQRWDQQVSEMSAILGVNDRVGYAYFFRGYAYGRRHQNDRMVADFEIFVRLEPSAPEAASVRQLLAALRALPGIPPVSLPPEPISHCSDGQLLCKDWGERCFGAPQVCLRVVTGYSCRNACDDPLDVVPFEEAGSPGTCGWSHWFASSQKAACDDWCGESCVKRQACGVSLCEPWPNYCWQCPSMPGPGGSGDPTLSCDVQGWFNADEKPDCDAQCGHSCERKQVCNGQLCEPWPHYCWRCGPPPASNTCEAQGWYEHDERDLCEQESSAACIRKQICGGEPCQPWPNYCWKAP